MLFNKLTLQIEIKHRNKTGAATEWLNSPNAKFSFEYQDRKI